MSDVEKLRDEILQELWPAVIGIFGFTALMWLLSRYESGASKHPKYQQLFDRYERDLKLCDKVFKTQVQKKTVYKAHGQEAEKIEYEEYVDRPNHTRCTYEARAKFLTKSIKLIKRLGKEKFCENNKNKNKCYRVTENLIKQSAKELRDVNKMIKIMDKRTLTQAQYRKVQKVLG